MQVAGKPNAMAAPSATSSVSFGADGRPEISGDVVLGGRDTPVGLKALVRYQLDLTRMPGALRAFWYSDEPDSVTLYVKKFEDAWLIDSAFQDTLQGAQLILRRWDGAEVPPSDPEPSAPWNVSERVIETVSRAGLDVLGHVYDKRNERAVFVTSKEERNEVLRGIVNPRIGNWTTEFLTVPRPAAPAPDAKPTTDA